MTLERLDHLVLTVRDADATCEFYRRALGMEVVTFGQGRLALRFGAQKLNLHPAGARGERPPCRRGLVVLGRAPGEPGILGSHQHAAVVSQLDTVIAE